MLKFAILMKVDLTSIVWIQNIKAENQAIQITTGYLMMYITFCQTTGTWLDINNLHLTVVFF